MIRRDVVFCILIIYIYIFLFLDVLLYNNMLLVCIIRSI